MFDSLVATTGACQHGNLSASESREALQPMKRDHGKRDVIALGLRKRNAVQTR